MLLHTYTIEIISEFVAAGLSFSFIDRLECFADLLAKQEMQRRSLNMVVNENNKLNELPKLVDTSMNY